MLNHNGFTIYQQVNVLNYIQNYKIFGNIGQVYQKM